MNNKIGFLLVFSIFINLFLIYRVFDFGVTVTHGADEISFRERQASDLKKLLPLLLESTSQQQLVLAARQAGLDVIEKPGEGIYVGAVFFSYSESKLTTVDFGSMSH